MKHIKSYRVFENEELGLLEMLDLGLIEWSDVPGILDSPAEIAKLLIELTVTDLNEGRIPKAPVSYLYKMGISGHNFYDEVVTSFIRQIALRKDEIVDLALEKFGDLRKVGPVMAMVTYFTDQGRPIIRHVSYESTGKASGAVFIDSELWHFFNNTLGIVDSKIHELLSERLAKKYGLGAHKLIPSNLIA